VDHPIGTTHSIVNDEIMENINENDPTPENDDHVEAESAEDAALDTPTVDETADSDETVDVSIGDSSTIEVDATVDEDLDAIAQDTNAFEFSIADSVNDEVNDAGDDMFDAAADDPLVHEFDGAAATDGGAAGPPPPPPVVQPAESTRLTRDPFAMFGGVLSGIAHHYGWDVSLTRLAFVVLTIATGGTALLVYFLAWLIIPRALQWPPIRSARQSRSGLSSRDLGIGLIAVAALIVLGAGSGQAAAVLVPLALVGGGIWMLVQNPREQIAPTFAAGTSAGAAFAATAPTQTYAAPAMPLGPPVQQQPAPRRSRLRRFGIFGGIATFGLLLIAIVLVPILLIGAITDGDFDLQFDGEPTVRTYTDADDIPSIIDEDAGELVIDLRNVDFSGVSSDDPIDLEVNLDAGEMIVRLPEDVRVQVDAESDFIGEVVLFGQRDEGFSPEVSNDVDDPQLILDLEVNAGRIEVVRGGTNSTSVITD
jgi:phage shock protein C